MSEDKLSKFEIAKAFAVLAVIITIYTVVTQVVVTVFWNLVLKLLEKFCDK
jgi:hypothetical protein